MFRCSVFAIGSMVPSHIRAFEETKGRGKAAWGVAPVVPPAPRPFSLSLRPPPPMLGACGSAGLYTDAELRTPSDSEPEIVEPKHAMAEVKGIVTLRGETALKRPRLEQCARERAMADLAGIVLKYVPNAPAVQDFLATDGTFTSTSECFVAALAKKSTATITKRAGNLRMLTAWHATSGLPDHAFSEKAVYLYTRALWHDSAPATRAASAKAALNFLEGLFGVKMDTVRQSSRITGMTLHCLRAREEVKQRRPLTASMVRMLEEKVISDNGKGDADAIVAGAALFACYGRLRVGDLRWCTVDPSLDLHVESQTGTLDSRFRRHKTAKPGSGKALPIAAPAYGLIDQTSWAAAWMASRRTAGLDAEINGTLIPARASTGWHNAAYTTVEFAASFRAILLTDFTADDLQNIGAHSLKATMLSWAAKLGLPRSTRRLLGYHIDPTDRAVETYSRDVLAQPLRDLSDVIAKVACGKFEPDASRSGLLVPSVTATPPEAPPAVDIPDTCSTSSSSQSSSSSVCSEDGAPEQGEPGDESIIVNTRTGFIHLLLEEGVLCCHKQFPKAFKTLGSLPTEMGTWKMCSRCF